MRAAVAGRYGAPIEIREVATPEPAAGEVRVRVRAAAVTAGDARIRAGRFPRGFGFPARLALGVRGPRRPVLGVAFAGVVDAVGPSPSPWTVGDVVAGMTGARFGAHAEFVVVRADALAAIPAGLSVEDAAAVLFGGSTARHFLQERAALAPDERLLVNGASGSVGSAAVQLGATRGAHVTAVTSARNADLVRRLGASETIDYARTPLAEIPGRFDVVFDAVGNLSRAQGLRVLAPGGRLILAVASLGETIAARGRVLAGPAPERADAFAELMALASAGAIDPLTDVVGGLNALNDAYARIDSGRKVGNLVVVP